VKGQQTAFVVEDGKQQATYEAIYGPLVFSPDGEHLAYIAQAKDPTANMTPIERQQAEQSPAHNRGLYLVLDGQQQQVPLAIKFHAAVNTSGIYFSPDSKHLAYTDYKTVIVDGRQVKSVPRFTPTGPKVQLPPATIHAESFRFSPDSKHLLYTIVLGFGHCLIDGDEVAGYQMAGSTAGNHRPTIQPDGSVFYFALQDAPPGAPGPSPTLYRVNVNPGPARDFGTAAADASASAATPANQPQANATPPAAAPPATPPPAAQQNKPPPQNTPADRARDQAQKAKDAANKLRGIFGR
jgi:dipeptidyl aminopeptidase/acylaminoacyl peptidase